MDGFGAIATFQLDDGVGQVRRFVKALKIFLFAESPAAASRWCHPATMIHGTLTPEERMQDRNH
jgi:cystathionine beta-lyase/cystathionine gamma-synthase